MAQHIRDTKHCSVQLAVDLLDAFAIARSAGIPVKQSKWYATVRVEGERQGSRKIGLDSPRREKHTWFLGTAPCASVEVYDRLVKQGLGAVPRGLKSLSDVDSAVAQVLRKHNALVWDLFTKAQTNRSRIFGKEEQVWNYWIRHNALPKAWFKINRGRDLFIKGLGSFNIAEAIIRLTNYHGPAGIHPEDITARGYGFSGSYTLQNLFRKTKWRREYFLRYKDWWFGFDAETGERNLNRVDELAMGNMENAYSLPNGHNNRHPEIVLREMRVRREEIMARNEVRAALAREARSGPIAEYGAFPGLSKQLPQIQTRQGWLTPIRNGEELAIIGERMGNCAIDYGPHIILGSTLLLALLDDQGEPLALGEVRYNRLQKRWELGQREGPHHAKLAPAMREVFETYPLVASGTYVETPDPARMLPE